MKTETFDELKSAIQQATLQGDSLQLLEYVAVLEGLNDAYSIALSHRTRGTASFIEGDLSAALEHYYKALENYTSLHDEPNIAAVESSIANVYFSIGDYPQALLFYFNAQRMYQKLGNQRNVAITTANVGNVLSAAGDHDGALVNYEMALKSQRELGDLNGAARTTNNIGNVYSAKENYPKALEYYTAARAIHGELESTDGIALVTGNIIESLLDSGDTEQARKLLDRMDAMNITDPDTLIHRETNRAYIRDVDNDVEAAHTTLREALRMAEHHNLRAKQADIHRRLRDIGYKKESLQLYVNHSDAFHTIIQELQGIDQQRKLLIQEKQRELESRDREHQKHLAILHSTLPKHIAERVARGEVVNDHIENAALLFMDIVGFTNIASTIPASHVLHLLDNIFGVCDKVCLLHNVTKIKTIGDAYMAAAGLQTSTDSAVVNIALVATQIVKELACLVIPIPESLGDTSWVNNIGEIQVRIGLHCGPVVAGVLGRERMQYDVWGDTVNVASRMESSGEAGKIHVSDTFQRTLVEQQKTKQQFVLIPRGEIQIKGKGAMNTFWLQGANND